jgi:hypothetical protein
MLHVLSDLSPSILEKNGDMIIPKEKNKRKSCPAA